MINTIETTPQPHAPVAVRRRAPHRLVAAGAVAALSAGIGLFAFDGSGQGSNQSAARQTVTRIIAPAGQSRCATPTAERLATAQVAFEGTVRSIVDGTVIFAPSHFFAGRPTDVVEVLQTNGATDQLWGASRFFVVGQTYLVSATDGYILRCYAGTTETAQLRALYDEAF